MDPAPPRISRTESTKARLSGADLGPRVCVVGAGSSGLLTLRALRERGLSPVAYELGSKVGGLWVYKNDNGRSSAYESLHINTSVRQMELPGFPMPKSIGDFPHRRHIAAYFEAFAKHYELHECIRFRTEIVSAVPLDGGGYEVTTRSLETSELSVEVFDALIVASGHHSSPRLPELPGTFRGTVLHSASYKSPTEPHDLREKNVLVVGLGNSAVDIASELSRVRGTKTTFVSARRGAWVLPKYVRGRPIDEGNIVPLWLPGKLRRRIVTKLFSFLYGKMTNYGLPEPDHLIGEAHPTISNEFPALVAQGDIGVRPALVRLDEDFAEFSDGSRENVDVVIFCTGYNVEFPFFSPEFLGVHDNELPLFLRIFPEKKRDLFFVGLAQPLGAIFPVANAQAQLIAEHLNGSYALPAPAELSLAITKEREEVRRCFGSSARHTMQLIPEEFQAALLLERQAGRRRAKSGQGQGYVLPHRPPLQALLPPPLTQS